MVCASRSHLSDPSSSLTLAKAKLFTFFDFDQLNKTTVQKKSSLSVEVSVAQWSKYILPNRRDTGSNLAWTQKHGCGQNSHLVVRSDLSMTGEPREGRTRSGGVYPGAPPTGTFGTMTSSGYTFCQDVDLLKKYPGSILSRQFSCGGFWITHCSLHNCGTCHSHHTKPSVPGDPAGI